MIALVFKQELPLPLDQRLGFLGDEVENERQGYFDSYLIVADIQRPESRLTEERGTKIQMIVGPFGFRHQELTHASGNSRDAALDAPNGLLFAELVANIHDNRLVHDVLRSFQCSLPPPPLRVTKNEALNAGMRR
jgi:hypothetical protein